MYIYISCIDCEGNKVKNMSTLCYGRKGGEGSYGSQKSEVKFDNFLLLKVFLSLFSAVASHGPSARSSHPLSYLHSITVTKPDL